MGWLTWGSRRILGIKYVVESFYNKVIIFLISTLWTKILPVGVFLGFVWYFWGDNLLEHLRMTTSYTQTSHYFPSSFLECISMGASMLGFLIRFFCIWETQRFESTLLGSGFSWVLENSTESLAGIPVIPLN